MSWTTSKLRARSALWSWFKPSSKIFYWPFQGGTSFVDLLCFFRSCVCYAFVSVCLCVPWGPCWDRADLLALVCGVQLWVCYFPIGILGQVWYLIVSIPDLWILTYFKVYTIQNDYHQEVSLSNKFWVRKRNVSKRRFFYASKIYVIIDIY